MKLLCLDLSTNTGWAIINNGSLSNYGNIKHKVIGTEQDINYPMNYIDMAKKISKEVNELIEEHNPNVIIIEETNKGKNRYWQKQLEFIHFAVNCYMKIFNRNVVYLDTSEWRKLLGLSLDKEQRQSNNEVKKQRIELKKQLENQYDLEHVQSLNGINCLIGKLNQKRALKEYLLLRETYVKKIMVSFRSKIDGKVVGKIGVKNLSVDYVNKIFDLKFKKKDNDIADAICLGIAYNKKYGN